MALAVKATPETVTRNPQQQLVVQSLLGTLYVLFSFGLVLAGLPALWRILLFGEVFPAANAAPRFNEFLADSLLILVTLPLSVGLLLLGKKLEEVTHPQPGARAGAFIGAFGVLLILLITVGIGNNWFGGASSAPQMGAMTGGILTAVLGGGLLFGFLWMFFKPGFGRWLAHVEEAGWFHAVAYKGNQGLRVRRGTVIGLLAVGVCGIYTMIAHRSLSSGAWELAIPFARTVESVAEGAEAHNIVHYLTFPLMFHVNLTLPIVLGIALGWFAWRVVNWPAFADFLIATEAEMNKVSWTTRKRLVQDTTVVLVTVFLLTFFLFIVDIFWVQVLQAVDVLQLNPAKIAREQATKTTDW